MARRTAAEHYSQAQETHALYVQIGGADSQSPGWAATLLFYTALQEVEAALRHLNHPPSANHTDRSQKIRAALPVNLIAAYENLEQVSKDARYRGFKPSKSRLRMLELSLEVVRSEIRTIAPPPY